MAEAKKTQTKKTAAKKPRRTQQKYYRNLRNVPVGLRLEDSDRKISLAARGQRGDIAPVKRGEAGDPIYLGNKDSIFEIITKEEADQIISKQATNIQEARRHPAWDQIRNPNDERYDQDTIVRDHPDFVQGRTVMTLDEDGNVPMERQGNKGVQIKRAALPGSVDAPHPVDQGIPLDEPSDYLENLRANTTKAPKEQG